MNFNCFAYYFITTYNLHCAYLILLYFIKRIVYKLVIKCAFIGVQLAGKAPAGYFTLNNVSLRHFNQVPTYGGWGSWWNIRRMSISL